MPDVSSPSPTGPVIRARYTVPELAELCGKKPKAMRRELRELGFPPPGKGKPEIIRLAQLRSLAPALLDSLVLERLSEVEARAYRARVGDVLAHVSRSLPSVKSSPWRARGRPPGPQGKPAAVALDSRLSSVVGSGRA